MQNENGKDDNKACDCRSFFGISGYATCFQRKFPGGKKKKWPK